MTNWIKVAALGCVVAVLLAIWAGIDLLTAHAQQPKLSIRSVDVISLPTCLQQITESGIISGSSDYGENWGAKNCTTVTLNQWIEQNCVAVISEAYDIDRTTEGKHMHHTSNGHLQVDKIHIPEQTRKLRCQSGIPK